MFCYALLSYKIFAIIKLFIGVNFLNQTAISCLLKNSKTFTIFISACRMFKLLSDPDIHLCFSFA